jgi:CheY-like chemotaxis protein
LPRDDSGCANVGLSAQLPVPRDNIKIEWKSLFATGELLPRLNRWLVLAVSACGISILQNRKAVFVVDDDPSMRRGVKRLLRKHGFETVLFDSAEALRNHEDFGEAFCIVLDINLNDASGIDLRHELVAAGILLPVIYITGNDNHATRMAALQSGCIAYLTKPFPAKSLIEPIELASARSA